MPKNPSPSSRTRTTLVVLVVLLVSVTAAGAGTVVALNVLDERSEDHRASTDAPPASVPSKGSVEEPAPAAEPERKTPSTPPVRRYQRADDLCARLDLASTRRIVPLKGKVRSNGEKSTHYSSARCDVQVEGRGNTHAAGLLSVKAEYLPHPAVASKTYVNQLRLFGTRTDQTVPLKGAWQQARSGRGNGISDTAASLLLQDGNLVLRIEYAAAGVHATTQAVAAVEDVARSVLAISS